MSVEHNDVQLTDEQLRYYKARRTKNMRMQVTVFGLMIFFTLIAFMLVAGGVAKAFVIPIILLLAALQVILQFYYFMHMKDSGHDIPKFFILMGVYFGLAFIIMGVYIVWLGQPLK